MLIIYLEAITFNYRNPLTTTSPISLPIPPPTSIYGLFAAILGKGSNNVKTNRKLIKKEIQEKVKNIEIYVEKESIENIKQTGILRFNVDKSKQNKKWFTPMITTVYLEMKVWVKVEFEEKNIEDQLFKNIKEMTSIFTPFLGSSSNLLRKIILKSEEEIKKRKKDLWKLVLQLPSLENGYEIIPIGKIPWEYDDEGNWILKNSFLLKD